MTPPDRLSLKTIFSNFLHDFLQAESGLWGTMVQMTIRPRRVMDTFLFKDRRQFIRPTRYLIFSLSLAAFMLLGVQWRYDTSLDEYRAEQADEGPKKELGALSAFALGFKDGMANTDTSGVKIITPYAGYLAAILIPALAFLYFIWFPGRKLNYAETLAGTVYLHAHQLLLLSLGSIMFLFLKDIADYSVCALWVKRIVRWLLIVSILRVFLSTKRDLLWLVPKMALSAVWVAFVLTFFGMILSGVIAHFTASEGEVVEYKLFCSVALFSGIFSLLLGRILFAFRNGWPRWYWWVPMLFFSLLFYAVLLLGYAQGLFV